jgi:exocyst complex component 2
MLRYCLQEMFPEATGDITSEKFDPAYFLLEHHHNTAFDDLKAGLEHLRERFPNFTLH